MCVQVLSDAELEATAGPSSSSALSRRRLATIAAPPASLKGLAPAGPYLLFLVGQGGSYSRGVWVNVT